MYQHSNPLVAGCKLSVLVMWSIIAILIITVSVNKHERYDPTNRYENYQLKDGYLHREDFQGGDLLFVDAPNFGKYTKETRKEINEYLARREIADQAVYGRMECGFYEDPNDLASRYEVDYVSHLNKMKEKCLFWEWTCAITVGFFLCVCPPSRWLIYIAFGIFAVGKMVNR